MAVVTPTSITLWSYSHTLCFVALLVQSGTSSPIVPSALLERLQEHHSSLSVSDESIVSDINFNSEDSSVSIDENNNNSTHTSANSTDVDEGDHSKCAKCRLNAASQPLSVKDEDTLHHLRIELIKAQILSKLKLEQPPKVSKSERIPDEIFKELSESDAQVEEEEPTKASLSTKIVVANARVRCPSSSPRRALCYSFRLPAAEPSTPKNSLFVRLPRPSGLRRTTHWVTVSKVVYSKRSHRHHGHHHKVHREPLAQSDVTPPQNGWVLVNISSNSLQTSSHESSNIVTNNFINSEEFSGNAELVSEEVDVILEIFCHRCTHRWGEKDSTDMPFITMKIDSSSKSKVRSKRATQDCRPNTRGCCRGSIEVNFSDFGWDDWIISPAGFTMYYCKGSCSQPTLADTLQGGTSYVGLLQRLLMSDSLSPAVREAVAPCCSPRRSQPLSIMWLESPNSVKMQHLPDMIVTECSCSS